MKNFLGTRTVSITLKAVAAGLFWVASATPLLAGQSYTVDRAGSDVRFLATGKPGFLKIKGEGGRLEGAVTVDGALVSGELKVGLRDFKTGIDLRDEHMHGKYLESEKFPWAILKIESLKFESQSSGPCTFAGQLTIKGVTKPASGSCEVSGLGSPKVEVHASAEVQLSDFPIGVPSHLGITVAEKVALETRFSAKLAASPSH